MTDSGLSIVWASRANWDREENDFYPTPASAVYPLIQMEWFEGNVLEPACGRWDISKCFIENGNETISTDLIYRWYGEWDKDFLLYDWDMVDNIVTNPPYKLAKEFIEHSKKFAKKKIAMFLKTVFLESTGRYIMFQDKEFPLKKVYQFCKRVPIYKNGEKMKNSWLVAYAWFVRDKWYTGKPTIERIN